ncbi:MAG TPA: GNAT family N-acetyltransferase [Gaiella sp.]|nr:GNAT family N-acetyltransferase [Gaiella sp.]
MRVEVVSSDAIGQSEIDRWGEIQQQPVYRSPFFRPEFTLAVGAMRKVRVAIVEDAGRVVGFFPFESRSPRAGRAVAWHGSDYHGPVLAEDAVVDPRALVRACRLATWSFDHLPAGLPGFEVHSFGRGSSPYLDLTSGFDPYLESKRKRSDVRNTLGRSARKLVAEVGPVRFVLESDDAELLERLVEWKRRQYAETGVRDVLGDAASRELLQRLHAVRGSEFAGTLSALYAGDVVAALHFGIRSARVLHSWFPVYNRELGAYSPGLMLLLELARAAAPLGIREIDLGKGETRHKLALASGSHELLEGCVGASTVWAMPVRARSSVRQAMRRAGVHRAVRRAFHRVRQ